MINPGYWASSTGRQKLADEPHARIVPSPGRPQPNGRMRMAKTRIRMATS
jgi:hypothetical protein